MSESSWERRVARHRMARRREAQRRRRRRRTVALTIALAGALVVLLARAGMLVSTLSADPGDDGAGEAAETQVVSSEEPSATASDRVDEEETVTRAESGLVVTGPAEFLGTEECAYLEEQIAELEEQDVTLGIVVRDLETGYELAYNADERLYPASSIKAAYCAMVCEEFGGAGELSDVLANCLINSSNEAYAELRETFGLEAFGSWLEEVGAESAADQARSYGYPDISASDLASVWEEIYRFGSSGEAGADGLVECLSRTNYTALGGLLRDDYEVWAKPGWYPTDEYDLTSTNDAGVVFSDCGPYVVVVMTSMNSDLRGLLPLVDAINAAHGALCGGSSELLFDDTTTIPGYS